MKVKELGHLAFKCRDLKRSERFYTDVLGFERKFSLKYSDRLPAEQGSDPDREWIVYLKVSDRFFIELFDPERELRLHGAPIDSKPELGIDNTWQMWSHDPDGNKIEFMQYTDKSYQLVGR